MNNFWQIRGEEGKSLNAELVAPETLKISNLKLRFGSLKIDQMTFTQVFRDSSFINKPELGQVVEFFRDGVRIFKGNCTRNRVRDTTDGGLQVDVIISGVWWWMEHTPLSDPTEDQSGNEMDRISYTFPRNSVREHLITLIDISQSLGCLLYTSPSPRDRG